MARGSCRKRSTASTGRRPGFVERGLGELAAGLEASSRTACSAQRCIRVAARSAPSWLSSQSSRSSAPTRRRRARRPRPAARSRPRRRRCRARARARRAARGPARPPRARPRPRAAPPVSRAPRAPLLGAELRQHLREPLEALAPGGDRLLERRARRPREVPARGRPRRARRPRPSARPAIARLDALELLDRVPQRRRRPSPRRAIRNARTTSATSAPRSATTCETNVGPSALTTELALTMQTSCVRSGCSASRCPQRSTTAPGK